ncbi:MAG TPA: ECF transporter S component [Phycisphaerae bacterium]|nr:ECF transporter S component [Phycisphaerae bacterium]HNU44953.1 ECF transporter S component [Phycisphaerae bacterium]
MKAVRRHFFVLPELLTMAALAALGGVTSSAISVLRAAVHGVVGSPVGLQFLAGIHVLWPVLAVGLVRKPGAATVTAAVTGVVELLAGNPHGLFVVLYAAAAGVGVDLVWMVLGGRHHPVTYMLAGGTGAAANVLVLKFVFSLSQGGVVGAALLVLATTAFVSGMLLAGLLGWSLLKALRRAGIAGTATA